jgi:hypothetical protein
MWQNCILRDLQTSCFQALIQCRVSENSTIALFTTGSYVHIYKFKICVHNSLQDNGFRCACIYTFNATWKIPANIVIFRNFCKYLMLEKAYVVLVVQFIWHRLFDYLFIHVAAINNVIMIMYLHYYFIYQCA